MNFLSIFGIVVTVVENVPAAIAVIDNTITAYKAATDTKGKLQAIVDGIESLATEVKSVISSL